TALFRARDSTTIQFLINNKSNVNHQDEDGRSALMWKILYGFEGASKILIENDCNVNIRDIKGNTALLIASTIGSLNIVKLLIRENADLNICNNKHQNPLIMTLRLEHFNISDFLVEKKANISFNVLNFLYFKPNRMFKATILRKSTQNLLLMIDLFSLILKFIL
ncbi:unnamed protein product, partial [marine sediment metagenome]